MTFSHNRSNSCNLCKGSKRQLPKEYLRTFVHLKQSTSNSISKMLRNNFERNDRMAVKRLNAMGIEAKSWYEKGKESKMSSQAPIEENVNQGNDRSKQHGHLAKSSSCLLQ